MFWPTDLDSVPEGPRINDKGTAPLLLLSQASGA